MGWLLGRCMGVPYTLRRLFRASFCFVCFCLTLKGLQKITKETKWKSARRRVFVSQPMGGRAHASR
jgi:hypothetical protein